MVSQSIAVKIPDATWFRDNVSCQVACPVHTDVSTYVGLIAEGRFDEAYALNVQANLFPEILGRVCTRPCEAACRLGKMGDPVAICHLKRAAADFGIRGNPRLVAAPARPEHIAIVGAGPSGLAAAHDLALRGYRVTVFEALPEVGGMLVVGIPAYRLPREVLQRVVKRMEALGITFKLNTPVGSAVHLADLQREFNAVLIAAGAHKPERLNIPGEDLEGVLHGVTFMRRVNTEPQFSLQGRRIAVIGGGYTAIDCARSAVRLGADEVHLLYRRTAAEMTVTDEEREQALEEGAQLQFLVSPSRVVTRDHKTVSGLECLRNRLGEPDASGRPRPVPIPGSEFTVAVDMVIPAVSQAPDISFLPPEAGLELSRWDRLVVDPENYMSSVPGIFAVGDFITGPTNVIEVIANARRAASSIHRYLGGVTQESAKAVLEKVGPPFAREEGYDHIPREKMPTLPVEQRRSLGQETEMGYTREQAIRAAKRCLQCQLNIAIDAERCILCAGCVDVCPVGVIHLVPWSQTQSEDPLGQVEPQGNGQAPEPQVLTLDEELCIRCGLCIVRCPTEAISMLRFACHNPAERWHVSHWSSGDLVAPESLTRPTP